MIRSLRNSGLGQIFLGAIVVAIIFAFILTPQQGGDVDGDDCAVSVGKSCVEPKEFQASLRLLSSIGLNEKAAKRLRLREKVARGLAEREVLVEEAKRLGLGTAEEDIDDELVEGRTRVSLPADGSERLALSLGMCVDGPGGCAPGTIGLRAINVKQNGQFDVGLYKRTVRVVSGRSPKQFKEMQQKEYTAERLRNLIRSQVRVSPEEAFLAYSRARSKATGRTATLKTSWFQRFITDPSEDEIKAWAEKNKDAVDAAIKEATEKWTVGCSVVSELRLNSADPTSDEAADIKKKAETLQTKAKLGGDFEELVRAQSQGESAALGGRIGCLDASYGAGAAALIDAAKELKREGEVSPVIESIRGFHVLKLQNTVTEENKEALVREFVTYRLASKALAQADAEQFAQGLIKKASEGVSLEEVTTAQLAEALEETDFGGEDGAATTADDAPKTDITRAITIEQNPIPDATGDELPGMILFDLKKDDDVAEKPIVTRDGLVVLQLKSKDLVTREKFEEESTDIMASLQKRKAEQALTSYVDSLLKKAGAVTLNPNHIPPAGQEKDEEKDS